MSLKILVSFNLEEPFLEEIQEVSSRIDVKVEGRDSFLVDAVRDVEVVLAGRMNSEMMKAAMNLKWIHSGFAGVERLLSIPEIAKGPVILTNSRGGHLQTSEHAMALMLAFTRRLKEFILSQKEHVWYRSQMMLLDELNGKTLGIIGLGSIGSEIAKRGKCFGMTVLATKRRMTIPPSFVDELLPPQGLKSLLERSDFVVVSTPLTTETRGMIGAEEINVMKKTAHIINIARGGIIKQKELIKALKEKRIAGAGLDAFEDEPLAPTSELWNMENVIITPHIAGVTIPYWTRVIKIFCKNLRLYIDKKNLINVVDKNAGY